MIVWIVGNGRSLEMTPPERIRKPYASFATNLIAKRYARTMWRPTWFVAVSDASKIDEYTELFRRGVAECKMGAFISDANRRVLYGHIGPPHSVIATYSDQPGWIKWVEPKPQYCRWGMSHLVSFQLAAEMQPEAVYMIGFDGNFRPHELGDDPNHFDPGYWGKFQVERPKDPEFWTRMNTDHGIAHSVIKAKYEELDIPLYNCTPDSAFTMHEYVPFEEAIRG